MKNLLLAASISALASSPALAQQTDLFVSFDADGNGVITQEELSGVSSAFTPQVYADLDVDASGDIVVEELGNSPMLRSFRYSSPTRFSREAPRVVSRYTTYRGIDRNGDGFLSAGELSTAIPTLNRTRYLEADLNRDGLIDFDELYGWRHMTRLEESGVILLPEESADKTTLVHDRVKYTRIDLNRDGAISMRELARIAPDATLSKYAEIDSNDDGMIGYNELYASDVVQGDIEKGLFVVPEADTDMTGESQTYRLDSYTFALLDTDSDYYLNADEIMAAVPDMAEDEYVGIDTDGDGVIRYDEFYASPVITRYIDAGTFVVPASRTVSIRRSYFTGIDLNGNGLIEQDEFVNLSPTVDDTIYVSVDANEDGVVSYDELYGSTWYTTAVEEDAIITPEYVYRYYANQ